MGKWVRTNVMCVIVQKCCSSIHSANTIAILFLGVEFKMVQENSREEVDFCPPEGRSKTKIPKCLRKPKTYHVDELYLFAHDLLTSVEGK